MQPAYDNVKFLLEEASTKKVINKDKPYKMLAQQAIIKKAALLPYFWGITELQAEKTLVEIIQNSKEPTAGTFLVRRSNDPTKLNISYINSEEEIEHRLISLDKDNQFYLHAEGANAKKFSSMENLLEYLKEKKVIDLNKYPQKK